MTLRELLKKDFSRHRYFKQWIESPEILLDTDILLVSQDFIGQMRGAGKGSIKRISEAIEKETGRPVPKKKWWYSQQQVEQLEEIREMRRLLQRFDRMLAFYGDRIMKRKF